MLKKYLALLLAVLLCFTAVACTTETPDPKDTETSSETESESETETDSETDTETETDEIPLEPDESELLPAYEGDCTLIDYTDVYNDCTLMTVQGATQADYEAYIAKFATYSNYTEIVAPHDVLGTTGNVASMYTKETESNGTYLINVLWISAEKSIYGVGEVKVTIEPLRNTDLSIFDPASATTGEVESLIIQIGMDEVKEDGTDANTTGGHMGYAYRLSDGSFFLLDGGGDNLGTGAKDRDCAARIYQTLKKYSPTENIVIAGWYFSHPHVDHMGGFMAFVDQYLNNPDCNITLENVICYMPNVKVQTYVDPGTNYSLSETKISTYNACLEELRANGTNIHKAHAGQMYYIRNMTAEILFTYDLLTPKLPDVFFTNDAYIQMKEPGVLQNSTGGGGDFTNSFSIIFQATVKVDEDTSYKALWGGDYTCFGIETVNKMYGFAMKSDFVQVPHHGSIQMSNGSESDPLIKNYHRIQVNHFFGSVYGAWQEEYTLNRFGSYFSPDGDGSYGYVRAKYILWPASVGRSSYFDDVDNAYPDKDISDSSKSNLKGWNPLYHLQDEARAAGGDVYLARCYLTVFTLGDTVTVTKDRDVIKTPMPGIQLVGTISSASDFANMDPSGSYVLNADITLTDVTGPLFASTFTGTLNGNGHTITFVYNTVSATTLTSGNGVLFAKISGATVKNLTISGAKLVVNGSSGQYGLVAGRAGGTVTMDNVHVKNSTITETSTSNSNIGVFFGDTEGKSTVTITNSSADVVMNCKHNVGGLIGRVGTSSAQAKSVVIQNTTVKGTLSTTGSGIGGLIGIVNATDNVKIENSTNEATVTGSALASGFVGSVTNGNVTLSGCTNKGVITGATKDAFVASGTASKVNCTDISGAQ
ncbi:MAG: hypothetical protein IKA05_08190 [Clostridia bacterium]|nr:hypothetical protein [Clostridia bacterium]